ncbi:MAG: hypothetical protein ABSF09_12320 [Candidatus Bathyarchaeia archaeon]
MKISHAMTMALLVLLIAAASVVANSSLVSADSCTAQLAITSMASYYNSNGMTVPVSAICTFSGGQLYAVGYAYDTSLNLNLGSANTVLTPLGGGNVFNGQLVFTLPTSVAGHTVQFSVSIYSTPNGAILTSVTQTVGFPNYSYSYPSYYYPGNCYYPGNSCYYYPSPPSSPPQPPHHHHEHPTPPWSPPEPPHHHHDPPTPCHDQHCRRR